MAISNKTYQPLQSITVTAGEDLPASRFVDHTGSLCATDSKSLGVTEIAWKSNEFAALITYGTVIVETSASVSIGDNLTSDTDGKAKPVATSEPVNARALEACTGAGFVKVILVQ